MTAPHPKIAWQMKKTPETIAFVKEASEAYFTRDDFRGNEREILGEEIERLVHRGDDVLVETSVDEWLNKIRTPKKMRTAATQHAFGALPPSGTEWRMGKTVAALDFVREAEQALAAQTDLSEDEKYKLEAKIARLKDGSEALDADDTFESWLDQLRDQNH